MKNSILNLGTVLSKEVQKSINGGAKICDHRAGRCYEGPVPLANDLYYEHDGVYHLL